MLLALRLTNFGVLAEVEVEFGPGLTVLTGETGAGKSMLIDALGLLAGARAEADVVRAGAEEASLEGVFRSNASLEARLEEAGLPHDGGELVIRRVIGRAGRGKVSINGALTTVGVLGRVMRGAIDIAGQHEHLALLDATQHLAIIDGFGGLTSQAAAYRSAWQALRAAEGALESLGGDDAQHRARLEFVAYQLEELDGVAPQPGEDASLETERRKLAGVERLRQLAASVEALTGHDGAALELVGRALAAAGEGEKLDSAWGPVHQALATAHAELDEAFRGAARYLHGLETNDARLAQVDERLDVIRRLCRKHGSTLDGVLAKRQALAAELEELATRGERRDALQVELVRLRAQAEASAATLSASRRATAAGVSQAVQAALQKLVMPKASFSIQVVPAALGADGADRVDIVFSANPGEPPRPLAKVASGGEAARVLLAMKSVLAASDDCAVSVFDEADGGVGGAVADVVGRLLKGISVHRQVLCITHLPQVAAHGDVHLQIEKAEARGRTRSLITPLGEGEPRAAELGRMLSGREVTPEALGAAWALLRAASTPMPAARARKRNQTARVERRVG